METEAHAAERAPLAWVRVLGRGALRLDFGHAVAVGALGRVLVAGRFDATPERASEAGDAGELAQLDACGALRWRLRIVRAARHCAPSVAMDDAGGAYLLGAFVPVDAPGGPVLVGMITLAITKLDANGWPAWCVPLADVPHVDGSATPASEALFVARVSNGGGSWARAIQGPQLQAGLSVHGDASGAVTIAGWCAGGAMDFGGEHIEAGERAAFFVARYGT